MRTFYTCVRAERLARATSSRTRSTAPLCFLAAIGLYPLALQAAPEPVEASPHTPEEIVITASPNGRSSEDLAIPVRVLDRDALIEAAGPTLGESLQSKPGISTSGFAPGASRPVIRGQDQLRVRILENGVGTGDASALSPDHGVTINPLAAQRVEVVQGPATLRYGGGAIGGVVNALTNRIPNRRVEGPIASEIYTSYGTGSRERSLAGLAEGDLGAWTWHMDALTVDSRDYDIPGSPSRQFNTDTDGYAFSGGGAWITEGLRFGGSITRNRNDYGIPAPEDPASPSSISLEQDHYAFELDYDPSFSWIEQIRLRGGVTEYLHDETVRGEGVAATFDNEVTEIRSELAHSPWGPFDGVLGFQFESTRFSADGEASELLPPSKTDLFGAFLFETLDLSDAFSLELAGRIERVRIDGTDLSGSDAARSFNPLSGSASLLYRASDAWAFGLTLTAAQRAPAALELFSQGPHDATATFELGDPDLDEERSLTADLSVRGEVGRVSGQVNVYYTDYKNFTFGRLTGASRDEDGARFGDIDLGELRELVYTQDSATFLGSELEMSIALLEIGDASWSLELQGDFVRARLSSGNVPRIPPRRLTAALRYDSPGLSGRISFANVSSQKDLADFEERTSGYHSLDASLRMRIAGTQERPVDLTVTLRNLLDARARNHVSFKKEDVELPGRSLRVGLHMRL